MDDRQCTDLVECEDGVWVEAYEGAGGGKGGGTGFVAPAEDQGDTARSRTVVKLLCVLGEGPGLQLVDGAKSIWFDQTVLQNTDGSFNFEGVNIVTRTGTPGQSYIGAMVGGIQTQFAVGLTVEQGTPITHTLTGTNFDRVAVTLRWNALYTRNPDTGRLIGTRVEWRIRLRYMVGSNPGPWVEPHATFAIASRLTAPYDRQVEFTLPKPGGGDVATSWEIEVIRNTPNSNVATKVDEFSFHALTGIIDEKLSYLNTALLAMTINLDVFGSNIPQLVCEVHEKEIKVPENYNSNTRNYSGVWNGTFKTEPSNGNHAWILYDLMVNDRYGLGEFLVAGSVNKWDLYEIAKYCDGNVEDGYGGNEPRFVFNGVIEDEKDAFVLLQEVAAAARAMVFYSAGSVMVTQDRPKDPAVLANPTNVIDGHFTYESTDLTTRHTSCVVWFNDPDDFGKMIPEIVDDKEATQRYGYRPKEIRLVGCRSRGQARRMGLWALYTDLLLTQTVSYTAGYDHELMESGDAFAGARPGDIIAVQDPNIAGFEWGGRVRSGSTASSIQIDVPVNYDANKTYSVSIRLPDGTVEKRGVNSGATGNVTSINVAGSFSAAPGDDAVWVLESNNLVPQLYQCMAVSEEEAHTFRIVGQQHEPDLFGTIDQGRPFDPDDVSSGGPGNGGGGGGGGGGSEGRRVKPPTNLNATEDRYRQNGKSRMRIILGWRAPDNMSGGIDGYRVVMRDPEDGRVNLGRTDERSIEINNANVGEYRFEVSTVANNGRASRPALLTFTTEGWGGAGATGNRPTVANLKVKGSPNGSPGLFSSTSCTLVWDNVIPNNQGNYAVDNVIRIFDVDTDELLREVNTREQNFTYSFEKNKDDGGPRRSFRVRVRGLDPDDREGEAAVLVCNNPVPDDVEPTVVVRRETIVVKYDRPDVEDFKGVIVYMSGNSSFDPGENDIIYDGPDNNIVIPAEDVNLNNTHYIYVEPYDKFGKTGLQRSERLDTTPAGSGGGGGEDEDLTAPDAPSAPPTVVATVVRNNAGDVSGTVTATWPTVGGNRDEYEAELRKGSGAWRSQTSRNERAEWDGLQLGQTYDVRVRSISGNGIESDYTANGSATMPTKSDIGTAPSNITATRQIRAIRLNWVEASEPDIRRYDIYHATNDTDPDANTAATFKTDATHFNHEDVNPNNNNWYWVRAVNTSGEKSIWIEAAGMPVTSRRVEDDDLDNTAPANENSFATTPPTLQFLNVVKRNGNATVTLDATWPSVSQAHRYEAELRKTTTGNWIRQQTVSGTSAHWDDLDHNTVYQVQVRTRRRNGAVSAYGSAATGTSPEKNTTLAAPGSPTVVPGIRSFRIKWNAPDIQGDIQRYELFWNDVSVAPADGDAADFKTQADHFVYEIDNALSGIGDAFYWWVRSVNTTGQKSAWTATGGPNFALRVEDGDLGVTGPTNQNNFLTTAVSLAFAGVVRRSGDASVTMTATWPTLSTADKYEAEMRLSGDTNWSREQIVGQPRAVWPNLDHNKTYEVRVRGRRRNGAVTAYASPVGSATSPTAQTIAIFPTSPTLTATAKGLRFKWTVVEDEQDIRRFEIYWDTTSTAPTNGTSGTAAKDRTTADHYNLNGAANLPHWFYVRSVNSTGAKSDWVGAGNDPVTPEQVADANYENPDLPSTSPVPWVTRFYKEVHLTEWASLGLVADSGTPPSQFGVGSNDAPIVNTAITETAGTEYKLVVPRKMRLGIRTSIILRPDLWLEAYGARFYKRAEFDTTAMFTQTDPNTRMTGPFRLSGINIFNDHPQSEDYGFGGDNFDFFCDDAVLEDIYCRVSDKDVVHGVSTKQNGRFMVWAGNRIRMKGIRQRGGKGSLVRSASNETASGIQAGGLYNNGGEDCIVEDFWIESDDDAIISIPKARSIWNGSTYPAPSNERADLSIKRQTYKNGRVWAWTGKMVTCSVQPNVGKRPNLQADIDAWKLTWEAPQQAKIEDILYQDIKGYHTNNAFKIANTRSSGGIRRITFRDCVSEMLRVWDDTDNRQEGNPNAILVEAARVNDENGSQYDHNCPVEDIKFLDCVFLANYRTVLEISTHYQEGNDTNYLEKFLPKNVVVRGGTWDQPEIDAVAAIIDGCDGGGLFGVELAGKTLDIIQIHDVPEGGGGFTVEDCIIKELNAGVIGVKIGNNRPAYGVKITNNKFRGPNANLNTVVVRFDGQPSPLSFSQDCVVRDNDFSKVLGGGDHIKWASESLLKNNQAYDNLGNGTDTRAFTKAGRTVESASNNRTLALTDAGKVLMMDNAGSINLNVPNNATVPFDIGTQIDVVQVGNGNITIVSVVGAGVTIRERQSRYRTAGKWARAWIIKKAADEWVMSGDIIV